MLSFMNGSIEPQYAIKDRGIDFYWTLSFMHISTRLSTCGYRESNPNLVLGKDAFYH